MLPAPPPPCKTGASFQANPRMGWKIHPGSQRRMGRGREMLMVEEIRSCKRKNSYRRLQGERTEIYALEVREWSKKKYGLETAQVRLSEGKGASESSRKQMGRCWATQRWSGDLISHRKKDAHDEPGAHIISSQLHVMFDPFSSFFSFLQGS